MMLATPLTAPPMSPLFTALKVFEMPPVIDPSDDITACASCHPSLSVSMPRASAMSLTWLKASLMPLAILAISPRALPMFSKRFFSVMPSSTSFLPVLIRSSPVTLSFSPSATRPMSPFILPSRIFSSPAATLVAPIDILALPSSVLRSAMPTIPPLKKPFLRSLSLRSCSSICCICFAYSLASMLPSLRAVLRY